MSLIKSSNIKVHQFIVMFLLLIEMVNGQTPIILFEGYLELVPNNDSSSIYIGNKAGQLINEEFAKNTIIGHLSASEMNFGTRNSFFGYQAGFKNGSSTNSFFGYKAGYSNQGQNNSFFGYRSGHDNQQGDSNTFIGDLAGQNNSSGSRNSFVGYRSGNSNFGGVENTILGYRADLGSPNLYNATAIGANSSVFTDSTIVLGRHTDATVIPGRLVIGPETPTVPHTVGTVVHLNAEEDGDAHLIIESDTDNGGSESDNPRISLRQDGQTITGFIALEGHAGSTANGTISNSILYGSEKFNVPLHFITYDSSRMTIKTDGKIVVNKLGTAASDHVCRNGLLELSTCSSSIRYKKEIRGYNSGLSVLNQLRPVSYTWKSTDQMDIGFIAEEVAEIDELLITRNDKGEIEGVKYDRLTTILVNAIKEQQERIVELEKLLNIYSDLDRRINQLESIESSQPSHTIQSTKK